MEDDLSKQFDTLFDKHIREYAQTNQYGVSMIPSHTHNGIDSQPVSPSNFVSLESATSTVNVSRSVQPTAGYALIANSSTAASWQLVPTSSLTGSIPASSISGTLAVANGGTNSAIRFVDNIVLTNQGADVGSTNFTHGNVAGTYRVSYTLLDSTADVTAGAVTLTIAYTDDAGSTTVPSAAVTLTGVGVVRTQGTIYIQLASGNIAYSTSHTGVFGTSKYAVYLCLERLS